jgi:hypothetical protein
MSRRYKSLHFNLEEGENVIFHSEHRSKRGRSWRKESSLPFLKYKREKKYGKLAKFMKFN